MLGFERKKPILIERKKHKEGEKIKGTLSRIIAHVTNRMPPETIWQGFMVMQLVVIEFTQDPKIWRMIILVSSVQLVGMVFYIMTITQQEFNYFLSNLTGKMSSNHIFNARIHNFKFIKEFLDTKNISFVRLSPYSADYNAIELFWNTIENKIKNQLELK